jgi:CRISPR-associated endonuclease/helicase Cas3
MADPGLLSINACGKRDRLTSAELDDFIEHYQALTGYPPFRWQQRLWTGMVAGNLPDGIDIPTGLGKTAIIVIWLLALAAQCVSDRRLTLPRRLIYVVNRRTVVDQATDIAERIREKLPAVPQVHQALGKLSADSANPLAISTLRGEHQDNKEWQTDPGRAAIIIGTVDMIGSKLLFVGYQSSQKIRPFLAGLIGQDALLIHDEAHLTPAFGHLIRQIIQTQRKQGNSRPLRMMELSATRRVS